MTIYSYKLILTGDGEDPELPDLRLPFSNINYDISQSNSAIRMTASIHGDEFSDEISNRSNGRLEFYLKSDSDEEYSELISAGDVKISIFEDADAYKLQLTASDTGSFEGSETIELDGILSSASFEDGKATFVTPIISNDYIPGNTIIYKEIEYGVGDVSFSYAAGDSPLWTINEGPLSESEGSGETCTFELISGEPYETTLWIDDCYEQYIKLGDTTFFCMRRWSHGYILIDHQFMPIKYLNFTIDVDSEVTISVDGDDLDAMVTEPYEDPYSGYSACDGENITYGFEAHIANGEYSFGDEFYSDIILSFNGNSEQILTLAAGVYTLIILCLYYRDYDYADDQKFITISYSAEAV